MHHRSEQDIMINWNKDLDQPVVSVCCTTYNHDPYIAEAIDGFLMQETDFPFEILIRDDCSTDKTAKIVKEYADKYPNLIKPVFEKENTYSQGVKPMPQLYKVAMGKYIALCEGDDYWIDPLKLQKQVDFLEENEDYVAVYHAVDHISFSGELVSPSYYYKDYSSDEMKMGLSEMQTSSVMYRNFDIVFPEEFMKAPVGDTLIAHLAGFHGKSKFLETILSNKYRIHSGGVWSGLDALTRAQRSMTTKKILRQALSDDPVLLTKIDHSIEKRYLELLYVLLRDGYYNAYFGMWKMIIQDKEVNTLITISKHFLDVTRQVSNKLKKTKNAK